MDIYTKLTKKNIYRISGKYGMLTLDDEGNAYLTNNKVFDKKIDILKGLQQIGRGDLI